MVLLESRTDESEMRLENLAGMYVRLINKLSITKPEIELCVITNNGRYANFRVGDFKKLLLQSLGNRPDKYRLHMEIFRDLGWIICESNRFTNTQKIKGKTVRVITVDIFRLKRIKEMIGFS